MSAANWYYAKDGNRFGPFTFEQFRQLALSGLLMPTDMVCNDEANQWISANSVNALFSASVVREALAPNLPGVAADRPEISLFKPDHWYYAKDRKKCGPVPYEQLREMAASGQLLPADMVLNVGATYWVAASEVPGLGFGLVNLPSVSERLTQPPASSDVIAKRARTPSLSLEARLAGKPPKKKANVLFALVARSPMLRAAIADWSLEGAVIGGTIGVTAVMLVGLTKWAFTDNFGVGALVGVIVLVFFAGALAALVGAIVAKSANALVDMVRYVARASWMERMVIFLSALALVLILILLIHFDILSKLHEIRKRPEIGLKK